LIEEWLNSPLSASAVAAGDDIVDEFEGEGGETFVRNYVTATMIRQELNQNPIIRDLKMAPDKIIGMALRSMDDWEGLGHVRRLGKKARWFVREGFDNPPGSRGLQRP
jgi:hypothetical protein